MKKYKPSLTVSIIVALSFFFAGMYIGNYENTHGRMARLAIYNCESTLPRNQTCEILYSTKIKETVK